MTITVADLAGVVYSAGKVFDGLRTGRLDTANFLRSGSTHGINSRADLALLEDLRDAVMEVLGHDGDIDADFVCAVNSQISRSGPLHPGQLRTADQAIGVQTRYGRHTPTALDQAGLTAIIESALVTGDDVDAALNLFVDIAKAQPFEDGNKRTALLVANRHLIAADTGLLLTIPVDDTNPALADEFNDLLAQAYLDRNPDAVKELLRDQGLLEISDAAE
ncbi:Fic family protein [Gordonia alkaliphila]|uniref:Fic family protein n=1 Tax=Gordonia alkaliphila TaxID=1053547 RepID=UPI001FF1F571|nr:Fic family protein [Gordonia alkaliphila]MCK0441120.1 Fic family protein [Gordonia alkaliphila]